MHKKKEKRIVAVFDFDGTLTTKDTLIEFIRYSCGLLKLVLVFTLYSPLLLLMKLHLYPNWKIKQKIFSMFFKGVKYDTFLNWGENFADKIEHIRNESTITKMKLLKEKGATIYVISASIDEWVRPFCSHLGVKDVLCTKVEVDSEGYLTGKFLTKNCYGQEKVNRFLSVEPDRDNYWLIAYGDSFGDKEMLDFADEGEFII